MRQRDATKPEMRTTALIFRSGKIVVTGAKSEELAETAAKHFSKILRKVFPSKHLQMEEFKVHNVVASCDFGFQISLESLGAEHNKFATYEPELFPGLIYRMILPKVCMLIFTSGKVVFTGAKSREDIM